MGWGTLGKLMSAMERGLRGGIAKWPRPRVCGGSFCIGERGLSSDAAEGGATAGARRRCRLKKRRRLSHPDHADTLQSRLSRRLVRTLQGPVAPLPLAPVPEADPAPSRAGHRAEIQGSGAENASREVPPCRCRSPESYCPEIVRISLLVLLREPRS